MITNYVMDIKKALENRCVFSALALALAIPDICGYAEYPDKSVSERYIEWYDRFIGDYLKKDNQYNDDDQPWLSGEMVYNLRNTYLHQGSPNITGSKIKESANQLDKFTLVLGDGTEGEKTLNFNLKLGNEEIKLKSIAVDVTFLCRIICDAAERYYLENKNKFSFDYSIVIQDQTVNSKDVSDLLVGFTNVLNKKLESQGSTWRLSVEDIEKMLGLKS
jgi:hypothetical protein